MKLVMAGAAALLLAACSAETPAPAAEVPAVAETPAGPATVETGAPAGLTGPSAGLWRATSVADGASGPPFEFCYEKQMTLDDAKQLQKEMGVTCSEETHTVTAGGLVTHAVCQMGDATVTTDTKMTGDFSTAYTTEIVSTTSPAPAGGTGATTVVTKMERVGDC